MRDFTSVAVPTAVVLVIIGAYLAGVDAGRENMARAGHQAKLIADYCARPGHSETLCYNRERR